MDESAGESEATHSSGPRGAQRKRRTCYHKQLAHKKAGQLGARLAAGRDNLTTPNAIMSRPAGGRLARTRLAGRALALLTFALLELTSLAPIESAPLAEQADSMIKVTRFQVPSQVRAGELRRLTCLYELYGATLHAMKLFKDDKEFYRFTPTDSKLTFPVVGVHVDSSRSNGHEVWLKVNKRTTGQYKCQVSVEGTFNSVSTEKRMEVVDGTSGPAPDSGHLAGASVWQQHLISQQQHDASRSSTRVRAPQAAVQQNPSQYYGMATGHERNGAPLSGPVSESAVSMSLVSLALLIWMQRPARLIRPR